MKVTSIQLNGFGKLVDRSFEFDPAFNLVFGPNEVGKSTLQQALLALLFGFFDEGRITTSKRAAQDSFKPWDRKASYEGSIIYSLDNSKKFIITRKFQTNAETSVFDLQNGQNISSRFPSADRGRLFVADQHLGINKNVFENTCFIRQAELVALESSATAITETLMSLSTTGSGNITTVEALASLETIIRDEIGSERAYTKPLAQATNLLKQLEEERTQILQKRREVYSLFRELNQCEDRLNELEAQRDQIYYKQSLVDFEETKSKNESINEFDLKIAELARDLETWKNWSKFPVGLRDDILKLSANRTQHQSECKNREQLAIEASDKLKDIEKAIGTQGKMIKEYEDAKEVSVDELLNVRNLKNKLQIAEHNVKICQSRLTTALEDLNNERERVDVDSALLDQGLTITNLVEFEQKLITAREKVNKARVNQDKAFSEWTRVGMSKDKYLEIGSLVQEVNSGKRPAPKPRKGCRSILSRIFGKDGQQADQTPTEMIIYAQIKPIYLYYSQAKEDYESSIVELKELEAEIRNTLGDRIEDDIELTSIQSIRSELEKVLELQASIKRQQKTLATLEDELSQANDQYSLVESELTIKLTDLGIDTKDLTTAINDYEDQCERKSKLEKIETELEKLISQENIQKIIIKSWEMAKNDLGLIDADLRKIFMQAGINSDEDSIENAIRDFEAGVKNYQKWETVKTNYEQVLKQRDILLEGINPENIFRTLKELRVRIDNTLTVHPEYQDLRAEKRYRDYEVDLDQISKKKEELQKDQLRLGDTIQQISNKLRSLAEVDEQIYLVKTKINDLEKFKGELELAINLLESATQEFQKQFAPRIERLMSVGVNQITKNRYSSVQVNPGNLNVSLVAPEIGKEVGVERLSTGTRDMVYLTLRIAIAQYMSRTGEKLPLLLDDPFVQLDQGRLKNALGYLQQLSQETQIIFFTKDEWVKNWFINNLPTPRSLIELI